MDLEGCEIFKVVDKTLLVKTVPTIYKFTYKTDTNSYLIKFKA